MKWILFLWMLLFGSQVAGAAPTSAGIDIAITDEAILSVKSENAPLQELFGEISEVCDIVVEGAELLGSSPVDFDRTGSVEDVVKGLLRAVGISSYALEFSADRLQTVRILPRTSGGLESPLPAAENVLSDLHLLGAQVAGRVEDGQVRHLDLQPGDLILTYGGVRINSAAELIRAVRSTSPEDRLEMLVIRDRLPIRIYLNGGFIGVRIKNGRVENRGLDKFLP